MYIFVKVNQDFIISFIIALQIDNIFAKSRHPLLKKSLRRNEFSKQINIGARS